MKIRSVQPQMAIYTGHAGDAVVVVVGGARSSAIRHALERDDSVLTVAIKIEIFRNQWSTHLISPVRYEYS